MPKSRSHVFRGAALTSGLLREQDLDEALAAVNAQRTGPPAPLVEVEDDILADKLVELGRLNRWQAEQLRQGRTRFVLGPYQIVDSIGQGGMGQVFKAEHTIMGRVVAVKVLPKTKSNPDSIAGFVHEIHAQAQLDHPHLVRAYDAGHDGNVYYLVTEYVPGMDLRRYVKANGALDQRTAATIISQVAKGLEHAHEKGLIHRDVKPGNVLVTPDGHAKLSDLGLVGFSTEGFKDADPRAGRIVGTADFLAPEVIAAPGDISPVSDIYALGCTLYYAVTGKVPFPGGTTRDKCYRHANETPLNPRRFNVNLTDDFMDVMADMMVKDPHERMATTADVIRRLARWSDEAIATTILPQEPTWARTAPPPLRQPGEETDPHSGEDLPEAAPHDSSSQTSQGTVPVTSAMEETATDIEHFIPKEKNPLLIPIIIGALAGAGLLILVTAALFLVKWYFGF